MNYVHRFRVAAPLNEVAEFHRQASSMAAITPPPIVVQMHQSPDVLNEGDEIEFTLWLLALPIRWRAKIEHVTATGFLDRQLRGPFGAWSHKHIFVPVGENETEVIDEIEARPGNGLLGKLLSLGMWSNLPILFAFRGWRTRRILNAQRRQQGESR